MKTLDFNEYYRQNNGDLRTLVELVEEDEKVENVVSSLESQGLLNVFDGEWRQGYYNQSGEFVSNQPNAITTVNAMNCLDVENITVSTKENVDIYVFFWDVTGTYISNTSASNTKEFIASVPNNATLFHIVLLGDDFTPKNNTITRIYVDNDISNLEINLSKKASYEVANGFILFRDSLNTSNYLAVNPESNIMQVNVNGILSNYALQSL